MVTEFAVIIVLDDPGVGLIGGLEQLKSPLQGHDGTERLLMAGGHKGQTKFTGAAGYELDRVDPQLGSPDGILVIARSENHAASYVAVPEELLTHISTVTGEAPEELIRADMAFVETASGGAVFSTGSITFCGSLPSNGFDNNISKLLLNVVRRFPQTWHNVGEDPPIGL